MVALFGGSDSAGGDCGRELNMEVRRSLGDGRLDAEE